MNFTFSRNAIAGLAVIVLCVGWGIGQPPAGRYDRPRVLCDAAELPFLVRGQVIGLRGGDAPHVVLADIRVSAIYHGQDTLVGRAFQDYSLTQFRGGSFGFAPADPPYQVGEEGLWWVREVNGRLQMSGTRHLHFLGRARKDHSPRYEQALTVAEAIGRLSRADSARQVELAREYAVGRPPELAAFAIYALAKARPAGADAFLDGLAANERLPAATQALLDEVLLDVRELGWRSAPRRLTMLARWVRGVPAEFTSERTFPQFIDAVRHARLTMTDYLRLMLGAVEDTSLSLARREAAVVSVAEAARRSPFESHLSPADEEAGIAWLADRVRRLTNSDLRLVAAQHLRNLAKNDPRAVAAVQGLLNSEQDNFIRAVLIQESR